MQDTAQDIGKPYKLINRETGEVEYLDEKELAARAAAAASQAPHQDASPSSGQSQDQDQDQDQDTNTDPNQSSNQGRDSSQNSQQAAAVPQQDAPYMQSYEYVQLMNVQLSRRMQRSCVFL